MKPPVPATPEHRPPTGMAGPDLRGIIVVCLLLLAGPVLIPAIAAADNVSTAGTLAAAGATPAAEDVPATEPIVVNGNVSASEDVSAVGTVAPAASIPAIDTNPADASPARQAPAETPAPEETVSPAVNDSPSQKDTQAEFNALMDRCAYCFAKQDYECAWETSVTAHMVNPKSFAPIYIQSMVLANTGNNTGALEKMDEVLVILPNSASMWKMKGELLNRAGRFTESDACFNRAQELNPNLKIPLTERFPFNMGMKNMALIIVSVGLSALGVYIYFREFRHS
jgi:hypothetical protein